MNFADTNGLVSFYIHPSPDDVEYVKRKSISINNSIDCCEAEPA